jgi:arylformamidase
MPIDSSTPATREPDRETPHHATRLVELSHVIQAAMVTLPSLPGPEITTHLTREASKQIYAPGTTFEIARISMVATTGTYLDSPNHRFESGPDLAGVGLEKLVGLPAVVVRLVGSPGRVATVETLSAYDVAGRAVLLHTGDDARFGTADYVTDAAFLSRGGAEWLVEQGAALVGIDAANIDDMADPARPAHSLLLDAEIPIVEHLTGLGDLPTTGASFTAVPPRIVGVSSFPVRAFAAVQD